MNRLGEFIYIGVGQKLYKKISFPPQSATVYIIKFEIIVMSQCNLLYYN